MATTQTFAPGATVVLLGTKRGLFAVTSADRQTWTSRPIGLDGERIYYGLLDQRQGKRLFAAQNDDFFGSFLRYSDDFGETWQEPERGIQFPEGSGEKLKNIWIVEPGRADEPGRLFVGVDPASLWESRDNGVTWELNAGMMAHPTRPTWNPGNGGLCLHTIVPDYSDRNRMWVGISAVGCMRSDDGGETWQHMNKGTRADFQPEKYPEYGQCLHRMVQHPTQPNVLYQQNHCGIYKTTNSGADWEDIRHELPSDFGFPIALDPHHPDTVFTVVEGEGRNNFGEQFTVYRTRDGGASWEPLTEGLPSGGNVRLGVLRHGMCSDRHDPFGIYVGTNTGQLFASMDGGDTWLLLADYLPSIYSVTATVVE